MKQRHRNRLIRAVIQVAFFLLAPGLYAAAFGGVRAIAGQLHLSQPVEMTTFVSLLLVLCAYTIVCGRFFCGYACAFGSIGDLLYAVTFWIRRAVRRHRQGSRHVLLWRIPLPVRRKLKYVKYGLLVAILVLCLLGYYEKIAMLDPWEVFGNLTALHFSPAGKGAATAVLVLIAAGMCVEQRFFCKFLCPMGAVFAILPVLPFSVLVKEPEECIPHCGGSRKTPPRGLCSQGCPADLSLEQYSGECIQCMECVGVCPKQNVRIRFRKLRGSEIPLVLAKAVILYLICRSWV